MSTSRPRPPGPSSATSCALPRTRFSAPFARRSRSAPGPPMPAIPARCSRCAPPRPPQFRPGRVARPASSPAAEPATRASHSGRPLDPAVRPGRPTRTRPHGPIRAIQAGARCGHANLYPRSIGRRIGSARARGHDLAQIGAHPCAVRSKQVRPMAWIASLTRMSEGELDRLIKRIAAILLVGTFVFVGFYVFDRFRMPAPSMVDQTIASLEAAVREDPSDISSRGQLADAYVVAERYEDAIAQYDAILATGKSDELAHFGRARANQQMGNLDAAKGDYQAVVDIAKEGEMAHVDPTLNAAFYGLGQIALQQGKPADAAQYLAAAVAIKRSDADALNLLGTAYVQSGEPAKAIEPLRSAIAFVPIGWSEPYLTLAQAYADTGDADRAEWAAAMADLSEERYEAATSRLEAILDGPAALEATIGLALVSEVQGKATDAADWYRKALVIDPDNASALLGFSRVSLPDETSGAGQGDAE
ncbi:MAG: tetratricopeptide repeat protein [Chloroflexota bacterium]|nr:MAG: tetratricopeptide repeat protein [Chloroflexota bacterium]